MEDGDVRGAVRLVSSTEPVRRADEEALKLLQEKHPPSCPDSLFPPLDTQSAPSTMSTDVIQAVLSFPTGSAGGPDGLRPQHLKDLVTYSLSEGPNRLIGSLT